MSAALNLDFTAGETTCERSSEPIVAFIYATGTETWTDVPDG